MAVSRTTMWRHVKTMHKDVWGSLDETRKKAMEAYTQHHNKARHYVKDEKLNVRYARLTIATDTLANICMVLIGSTHGE